MSPSDEKKDTILWVLNQRLVYHSPTKVTSINSAVYILYKLRSWLVMEILIICLILNRGRWLRKIKHLIEVARGLLYSMHVPKDFSLCLLNKKYHTFVKKGKYLRNYL